MSAILGIDTSTENAIVCLSVNGDLTDVFENNEQKDHAAWLHSAVNTLLTKNGSAFSKLDAVAVTLGPGSYTGLRVGLSAAKGFCYALNIPLLGLGTLNVLANAVKEKANDWVCPMIDARRMEVFTAIFDKELNEKIAPLALILNAAYFESILEEHDILFCGNGAEKLKPLLNHPRASFLSVNNLALSLIALAENDLKKGKISDIAYSEPLYLKEFYSSTGQAAK